MTENSRPITIRNWLYFNAFMVFCMAIIGAITRLTESGLSMVEWRPLIGTIPPLSAEEWTRVFDLYRQTPEYQFINTGMSLAEFQYIFFWEWFHRVWGRLIGLTYALPLIFFWVKNWIPVGFKKPLIGLLILGGLQAVMGYVMVLSGLVDEPAVSHYRLAAHLSLAFIIFGCLIWVAMRLDPPQPKPTTFCRRRHGWSAMAVLAVTIIWGAFMAGKDAGLVSSTWPLMYADVLIPPVFLSTDLVTFFENAEIIHFVHRWIAVIALFMIFTFAWRVRDPWLGVMVFIQFGLGIVTIMTYVSIPVATLHQAGALILVGLMLKNLYKIKKV
jgi:cytochrome c oxidase assembly protein subunit 15